MFLHPKQGPRRQVGEARTILDQLSRQANSLAWAGKTGACSRLVRGKSLGNQAGLGVPLPQAPLSCSEMSVKYPVLYYTGEELKDFCVYGELPIKRPQASCF